MEGTGEADQAAAVEGLRLEAQNARQRGDTATARQHLEAARALGPTGGLALPLDLLEAELLMDAGQLEAADAVLAPLCEDHPESVWPPFKRAEIALRQGDRARAEGHLAAALSLDPDAENLHLWLMWSETRLAAGHKAGAVTVLERLCTRHPDSFWPPLRLAQLAWQTGDLARARRFLDQALERDPEGGNPNMALLDVELLTAAGQEAEATERFAAVIARHPTDPALLRRLYAHEMSFTEPALLDRVNRLLWLKGPPGLASELGLQHRIATMQYQAAWRRLRQSRGRRDAVAAGRLAMVLLGLHRYDLGLRYLRFAQRRFAANGWLAELYIDSCLRLGRLAEAERALTASAKALPKASLATRQLALAARRGDLAAAADAYVALKEQGQLRRGQREILGRLVFAKADPLTLDTLYARTGSPIEGRLSLHRDGPVGALLVEFELERQALAAEDAPPATPADWARARPGSTVAAIRLVDAWRSGADTGLAAGKDSSKGKIETVSARPTRQILQFWDAAEIPEAEARRMASWAAAEPNYAYRRFDRQAALRYMRDRLGPEWARAFKLARDPEQEVDLLRLGVLAAEGGVWADVDTVRIGPLDRLTGAGRGLILCRDPETGAPSSAVIAAAPRHPVILSAAQMARAALLSRAGDNAWSKTGGGLLTRALAQYLLAGGTTLAGKTVTLLEWEGGASEVFAEVHAAYRGPTRHWGRIDAGRSALWSGLAEALEALPDRG